MAKKRRAQKADSRQTDGVPNTYNWAAVSRKKKAAVPASKLVKLIEPRKIKASKPKPVKRKPKASGLRRKLVCPLCGDALKSGELNRHKELMHGENRTSRTKVSGASSTWSPTRIHFVQGGSPGSGKRS
jgi:hypothetical protein